MKHNQTDCKVDDINPSLRHYAQQVARANPPSVSRVLKTLAPNTAKQLLHELQVHQIELELQNEELRHTQAALQAARMRYYDLYEFAPVAYLTLDKDGLIQEANLTAAELLGVARSQLLKQAITLFITPEHQDGFYLYRRQLSATEQVKAIDLRMRKEGGECFWGRLTANLTLIDSETNELRVVVTDISESKQAAQMLLDAETQVESSKHLQARFITNFSHQIRTPMNVIIGFSELLQFQEVSREVRTFLNHIHSASRNLHETLDSILDFSRIEENVSLSDYQQSVRTENSDERKSDDERGS